MSYASVLIEFLTVLGGWRSGRAKHRLVHLEVRYPNRRSYVVGAGGEGEEMLDFSGSSLGDLVRLLRQTDRRHFVFGSPQHKYKVGSVLSAQELRAFELANGIELPADYRLYLSNVGNGGAGPYYGLEPLGTFGRDLSRPFPLTRATQGLSEEELDALGDRDEYPGVLEFCHHGCAIYSYVVVNGPGYGTMWVGREDFYPTGLSFDQWFRKWAERALRALGNRDVAKGIRVGMSRAEVVAMAPSDWKRREGIKPGRVYFEASDVPVQLVLDEREVVVEVRAWPFI